MGLLCEDTIDGGGRSVQGCGGGGEGGMVVKKKVKGQVKRCVCADVPSHG